MKIHKISETFTDSNIECRERGSTKLEFRTNSRGSCIRLTEWDASLQRRFGKQVSIGLGIYDPDKDSFFTCRKEKGQDARCDIQNA